MRRGGICVYIIMGRWERGGQKERCDLGRDPEKGRWHRKILGPVGH